MASRVHQRFPGARVGRWGRKLVRFGPPKDPEQSLNPLVRGANRIARAKARFATLFGDSASETEEEEFLGFSKDGSILSSEDPGGGKRQERNRKRKLPYSPTLETKRISPPSKNTQKEKKQANVKPQIDVDPKSPASKAKKPRDSDEVRKIATAYTDVLLSDSDGRRKSKQPPLEEDRVQKLLKAQWEDRLKKNQITSVTSSQTAPRGGKKDRDKAQECTVPVTAPVAPIKPRAKPLLREPRLCLEKKQRCIICSVEKGAAGHLLKEYDQLICKVCLNFFSKFLRIPQHLKCNGDALGNCQLLVAPRCRACWAQSCVNNLQFDEEVKDKLQAFIHEKEELYKITSHHYTRKPVPQESPSESSASSFHGRPGQPASCRLAVADGSKKCPVQSVSTVKTVVRSSASTAEKQQVMMPPPLTTLDNLKEEIIVPVKESKRLPPRRKEKLNGVDRVSKKISFAKESKGVESAELNGRDLSGVVLSRKIRCLPKAHVRKRWENVEPTLNYPGIRPLNWSSLGEDLTRVLNIGLPVIVTNERQLSRARLCFVCASSVKQHGAIHCAMCCEPYHTFCVQIDDINSVNELNWLCPKCQACSSCGRRDRRNQMLKCNTCRQMYHQKCIPSGYPAKPSKRKNIWTCNKCVRCKSCDTSARVMAGWNFDLQLCTECVSLRQRGNYCPICERCYDADDFEIAMVECGACRKWVHSQCENLNTDEYQLLSILPDNVTFTCSRCDPSRGQRDTLLSRAMKHLNHNCVLVLNRIHSHSPATMALADEVLRKASSSEYRSLKEFCHDILQAALRGGVAIKPLREMLLSLLSFYFRDLNDMIDSLLVVVSPTKGHRHAGDTKDSKENLPILPPSTDHEYARFDPARHQQKPSNIKKENVHMNDSFDDHLAEDNRNCVFCLSVGDDECAGRLLYLGCDCWGHTNCTLWSAEVYQDTNGFLRNVYMAYSRGRFLKCELCATNGATIGCCERNCVANFHYRCAIQAGAVFCKDKSVFCLKHSRLQGGIEPVRQEELACFKPMYVDQSELKNNIGKNSSKSWSQGCLPVAVRACIGNLQIECLGRIDLASDFCPDILVPVDFRCRRVFWSVNDATKRTEYLLSTRQVEPRCFMDAESHSVIDHVKPAHFDVVQPTYDAERELDTRLLEELSRCVHSSNSHIDLTELLESVTRSLDPDLAAHSQNSNQNANQNSFAMRTNSQAMQSLVHDDIPLEPSQPVMDQPEQLNLGDVDSVLSNSNPPTNQPVQPMEAPPAVQSHQTQSIAPQETTTSHECVNHHHVHQPVNPHHHHHHTNCARHAVVCAHQQSHPTPQLSTFIKRRPDGTMAISVDQITQLNHNARASLVNAALVGQNPLQVAVNSGLLLQQPSVLSPSGVQLLQQPNGSLLLSPNGLVRSEAQAQLIGSPTGVVNPSQIITKVSPPRPKTILPKVSSVASSSVTPTYLKTSNPSMGTATKNTTATSTSTSSILTPVTQTISSNPILSLQGSGITPQLLGLLQQQQAQTQAAQQPSSSNAQCEVYEVPGGTIIIPKKGLMTNTPTVPTTTASVTLPQGSVSYLGGVPFLSPHTPWPLATPTIQLVQTPTGQQAMLVHPFLQAPMIYPQLAVPNLLFPPSLAQLVGQQGARSGLIGTLGPQGLQFLNPLMAQKAAQPSQVQQPVKNAAQSAPKPTINTTTSSAQNLSPPVTLSQSRTPVLAGIPCLPEKSSPSDVVSTTTQDISEDKDSPRSHLEMSSDINRQRPNSMNNDRYPEPDSSTNELPLIERMGGCSPLSLPPPQSPFSSSPSPTSSPCDQEDDDAERILALLQKAANKIMDAGLQVEVADSCTNDEQSLSNIECTPLDLPEQPISQSQPMMQMQMSHSHMQNQDLGHNSPEVQSQHHHHHHHHHQRMEQSQMRQEQPQMRHEQPQMRQEQQIRQEQQQQQQQQHSIDQGIHRDSHSSASSASPTMSLQSECPGSAAPSDEVMFPVVPPIPKSSTSQQQSIEAPPDDRPYLVYSIESSDGSYKNESHSVNYLWRDLFEKIQAARAASHFDPLPLDLSEVDGYAMMGLRNALVAHLIEQLPEADECLTYEPKYHKWKNICKNPSGAARLEAVDSQRSDHDMFSWLTSYPRHPPKFLPPTAENDVTPTCSKRQTSLDLPDAMRYRHLKETTKVVAGVYRSGIHGRGLYCKKDIAKGEMIIEYSGEVIRGSLCDIREKYYESRGLGCYMFRIDNDQVVDATVKGNAARFINHSCDPNCYSKMITVDSKKHIVIFALREIRTGEELTYDYKFPIEDDKVHCTCGSRRCRKFMN